MSKHTPGPWRSCERGDYSDYHGASVVIVSPVADMRVAVVHHHGTSEADANASLIAAAPELLAALKEVVRISNRNHAAWDKARAAIAKAEGREL